jgi:hypothetical protein
MAKQLGAEREIRVTRDENRGKCWKVTDLKSMGRASVSIKLSGRRARSFRTKYMRRADRAEEQETGGV